MKVEIELEDIQEGEDICFSLKYKLLDFASRWKCSPEEALKTVLSGYNEQDEEMLNFLDSLTLPNSRVTLRRSTTGGGWRMHDVEGFAYIGHPTVRDAIKAYQSKYNDS